MKCVKCGKPITPGNSRVLLLKGKKLREHRKCPSRIERGDARSRTPQQARLPRVKTSEPEPSRQASVSDAHRYFVMPGTLERFRDIVASRMYHAQVSLEVHAIPAALLEGEPELAGDMIEIFIKT